MVNPKSEANAPATTTKGTTMIDIDSLTIGQARQIAAMVGSAQQSSATPSQDHGLCILVADHGWVFVGRVREEGDRFLMDDSQCVRRWGTTNGLEELADSGPLPNTKLDAPTRLRIIPRESVKFIVACNAAAWSK